MPETESDYPLPPDESLSYRNSWRPEDKAVESAEVESLAEHPKSSKESAEAAVEPSKADLVGQADANRES